MALVNIPRDRKDAFYRYKMPAMIAKVEGRGNGIKTVIVNMTDIAKSLDRPASYPTKFFGFELGALTTIDDEKERYIVNGKHDQSKLAEVLDTFIEKFVLCHQCERNPETTLVLHNDTIELTCKACGLRSPVDMRHKITTFILRNPPPSDSPKKGKSSKSATKTKKGSKSKGSDGEDNGTQQDEAKPKSRSKKGNKSSEANDYDDDDVVWHTDTSAEAAAERRRQMLDSAGELAAKLLVSPDKKGEDPVERLMSFIATGKASDEQIVAEIQKVKEDEKWDDERTATVAFELLFNKDILAQLKSPKVGILGKFVAGGKGQAGLLGAIVELCGVKDVTLLKSVPVILKTFYDLDILDEDSIVRWGTQSSANGNGSSGAYTKVKEAAAVFVNWLNTAEEESDEEDD